MSLCTIKAMSVAKAARFFRLTGTEAKRGCLHILASAQLSGIHPKACPLSELWHPHDPQHPCDICEKGFETRNTHLEDGEARAGGALVERVCEGVEGRDVDGRVDAECRLKLRLGQTCKRRHR